MFNLGKNISIVCEGNVETKKQTLTAVPIDLTIWQSMIMSDFAKSIHTAMYAKQKLKLSAWLNVNSFIYVPVVNDNWSVAKLHDDVTYIR